MSALLEAIRRIEKACICGEEIGTTAFGPTGEEYRIVYAGGLGDGEGHPALYRTPDLAAMAWEASVRKYAATVRGATLDALCAGADRDEYDCFEPDQREDGSRTVRNTRHLYWHIRPEIVEAANLKLAAQAEIDAQEAGSLRTIRELLLNPNSKSAKDKLQAIDDAISAKRDVLRWPV